MHSIEMGLYQKHPFYQFWTYYNSILTETHLGLYQSQADEGLLSVVIYLDQEHTELMKRLISHFILVDFAGSYHLITPESICTTMRLFYYGNPLISTFSEEELFTEEQRAVVARFSEERRRQVCRFHLIRRLRLSRYVLI